MELNTPVSDLSRVGKTVFSRLKRLGVTTVRDLLYYFPFRYEDFRKIVPIADLQDDQLVTVCGLVELISNKRSFRTRKMITEALVSDKSGTLKVVWFNQPFLTKNIHPGEIVYLSGKVKSDMLGPQLVSPVYEKFSAKGASGKETVHTARLVPIYPLTYGLTQKQIRFLINQIIKLADAVKEWMPEIVLEKEDLVPLASALKGIHFPKDEADLKQSTSRLKFDELFILQLKAELTRLEKNAIKAPKIIFKENEIKSFVAGLPFTLTATQKISAWEILQDIAKDKPMSRLLSGDVGSGKTVVAAMAMYSAYLNNFQSVIMAPTEILANQHYQLLVKLFKDIKIGLLTGSTKDKKAIKKQMVKGEIKIIVGTHALLSEGVDFKKLGLVVVDEQHHFGVEQRRLIKEKGRGAHFLSMTATPIPRSLALVVFGDLDVSTINELPPGRKKILTRLVEPAKREQAYGFIREQIKKGRQAFVICPIIEEQETEKKSVTSEYEKLSKKIFPDLRVGYLHGKMKSIEKERVMAKFKAGEIDVLVSTSVIEAGIDMPNASIMMIEGAENFGLAQLHQFRGRVGRSEHQSYCLLFTGLDSVRSKERLQFFEKNNDGFKLAEKDLEMRGPGEVYGVEQSGMMNLRLAQLTDRELIKKAREAAKLVVPDMPKYPNLSEKIQEWEDSVHLE